MVKIYQQPFAHAGTKQVIPDSSDPQGFVSNEDGFTTDYELPDTDPNYKPIERAEFNGLMNMVTEAVGELQQFGFAKWQAVDGGWPVGANVNHGGGVWQSLANANTEEPGDGALWKPILFDDAATLFPFRGIQVYDTAGIYTWTIPDGVAKAWVTVVGGGGPGSSGGAGAGGGAGGAAIKLCDLAGATEVPVTVGVGPSGVAGGASAINGGASSFGGFCSATGGERGSVVSTRGGGHGGFGVGGDANFKGTSGGDSQESPLFPGNGGGSIFAGGGRAGEGGGESGRGGGGGGGTFGGQADAVAGGGGDGIVIIQW